MKRTKIVIGLSVLLLAGIGAFASTSKPKFTTYFYIPSGGGCEISPSVDFTCSGGSPSDCKTTVNSVPNVQLYGVNPGGGANCTTALKKD